STKGTSGQVNNVFLTDRLAGTGKPVILSSGMSSWAELERAVAILRQAPRLIVLQCSSSYPCPPDRVGLNVLQEIRHRYAVEAGLSDHTLGCAAAFAAAALGATVIEKHVTFSKLMYGSDARHSMEPVEFRTFCGGLKEVWDIVDHPVNKDDVAPYGEMKRVFEKSLVSSRPLTAGHALCRDDLAAKKPGDGIPAAEYAKVIGRQLIRAIPADHMFSWTDL